MNFWTINDLSLFNYYFKNILTVDMSSFSEDNKPEDEPSDSDDDGPSKPKRCKMLEILFQKDESNSGPNKKERKDTNRPPKKSSNAASTKVL